MADDNLLVGQKLTAVAAKIRQMANDSGYGHFITDGTCQQWAAAVVNTVDDVETQFAAAATPPTPTVAGVPVAGEMVKEQPKGGLPPVDWSQGTG